MTDHALAHPGPLVDCTWLAKRLGHPRLRIVDATWFPASAGRDADIEWELRHIPGAVRFNVDDIAAPGDQLPHMVPDAATFGAKVGALGIGNDDLVVCYDTLGGFCAAARAWWMFRLFGHDRVALLDGGMVRWTKQGLALHKQADEATPAAVNFVAQPANPALLRTMSQMVANLDSQAEQVIDARAPGRFRGEEPEPRPSKRLGHIPHSLNVPFGALMHSQEDWRMRTPEELRQVFAAAGVDLERPIAATCGSGVTACLPAFALFLLGNETVAVYDGSWAEWGDNPDLPMAP